MAATSEDTQPSGTTSLDLDAVRARAAAAEGASETWDAVDESQADVPALLAEVDRLHTWDGLMSLLDEHWPNDIFPTLPDEAGRDVGARIVSLLRRLHTARAQALEEAASLAESRHDVAWEGKATPLMTARWPDDGRAIAAAIRTELAGR